MVSSQSSRKEVKPRSAGSSARLFVRVAAVSLLGLGLGAAAPAVGPTRVALVVGVANYKADPLVNSVSDARLVAEQLTKVGFKVQALYDRPGSEIVKAIAVFKAQAKTADAAVIYFAGHGMELAGQNYVLPSDAQFSADRVVTTSVFAGKLREGVAQAKSLRLVILDACRNNPLEEAGYKGGLARESGGDSAEVVTLMAAQPGKRADDGKAGSHSPFVLALVSALQRPGVTVGEMASYLQSEVRHRTADPAFIDQTPDQQGIWSDPNWSFDPAGRPVGAANDTRLQVENIFWSSIRDSNDPDDFRIYLKEVDGGRFTGLYIALAFNRIDKLGGGKPVKTATNLVRSPDLTHPADVTGMLDRGRAALLRADYATAIREWHSAADAGSAVAMSNLGLANVYGYEKGPKTGMATAAAWFKKSAEAGNPSGMVNYAALLLNSRGMQDGVKPDVAAGLHWLDAAANAGNPTAMQTLGEIYARGERQKQDYRKAVDWMQKAVDAGDGPALTDLAYWYEGGVVAPKNTARALELYNRAAVAGRSAAMLRLGELYQDGDLVKRDMVQAATWYQRAAAAGSVEAAPYLGALYETGAGVPKDAARAIDYYRRGAKAGDAKSRQALDRLGVRD